MMWKSYQILAELPDGFADADRLQLSDRVNQWLALGWQPLGGVVTGHVAYPEGGGGGVSYAQTLVHADANAPRPERQA